MVELKDNSSATENFRNMLAKIRIAEEERVLSRRRELIREANKYGIGVLTAPPDPEDPLDIKYRQLDPLLASYAYRRLYSLGILRAPALRARLGIPAGRSIINPFSIRR